MLATYTYDNLGRVTSLTRGNEVVTGFDYDAAGRLAELTQDMAGTANDQTLSFTYNAAGQIGSLASRPSSALTRLRGRPIVGAIPNHSPSSRAVTATSPKPPCAPDQTSARFSGRRTRL